VKTIALVFLAVTAYGQQHTDQPVVENGKVETQAFSGSLAGQLAALGAGPYWAGYREASVKGHFGTNCFSDDGAVSTVHLEGERELVVLVRVEGGQIAQLRTVSPDCRLEAGGLRFVWINNVPTVASVAWLKTQVNSAKPDRALSAIALHDGAAADQALDEFTAPAQNEAIREKAAFWLGNTRGAHGVATLKRMLASDPDEKVREKVVFALSQSKEPEGVALVIDAARNDRDPKVRGQALFWLAQKAGNKQAAEVIGHAATTDPNQAVKERAVFALSQLPKDQGIPLLIALARDNADPAVRKKAVFWLGQSKDPRALEFFAEVLK